VLFEFLRTDSKKQFQKPNCWVEAFKICRISSGHVGAANGDYGERAAMCICRAFFTRRVVKAAFYLFEASAQARGTADIVRQTRSIICNSDFILTQKGKKADSRPTRNNNNFASRNCPMRKLVPGMTVPAPLTNRKALSGFAP